MAARVLSCVDSRLDESSDAPDERAEGSLRTLLKGRSGYETESFSSTLVPFSLGEVSLPQSEQNTINAINKIQ